MIRIQLLKMHVYTCAVILLYMYTRPKYTNIHSLNATIDLIIKFGLNALRRLKNIRVRIIVSL